MKIHTKNKTVIQVEIQIWPIPDMKERVIYSQAKMITEQISAGNEWAVINRVITIVITDYTLVQGSVKYYNRFGQRTEDGIVFSDLTEINTLELNKLTDEADGSELWDWAKFIKSDDREVIEMVAEKNPMIGKAVAVLKELSADERTRMINEDREKARRDMASMMSGARREGKIEGIVEATKTFALKLIKSNKPIDEIIEFTGLSREEIERLQEA